jgi:uncharacterized membrane protein YgcG
LRAALEELVADLQRSLPPLPAKLSDPAAEAAAAASSSSGGTGCEYGGEALVAWLVATRRAASASHGMLLGNLLVHAGMLKPTPGALKQQQAWENFNARQQQLPPPPPHQEAMGGGAGRPFSDVPTLARSAAAAQAAAAEAAAFRVKDGMGSGGNSSGGSSGGSSSNAPDALYFASNPRLALLRFTVAGRAAAEGWADGVFGGSRQSSGGGAVGARAAEEGELELKALAAAVAAEEAALAADKEVSRLPPLFQCCC